MTWPFETLRVRLASSLRANCCEDFVGKDKDTMPIRLPLTFASCGGSAPQCPLWVISGRWVALLACPLCASGQSRHVARSKRATPVRSQSLSLALELERDFHLRAIRFDFSILELHVLLHDLCDPKVPQRFPGPIHRSFRGLFPRFSTGAD